MAEACPRYIGDNGLGLGCRRMLVEHCLTFFLVEDEVTKVDRILHSRRDFDWEPEV